jgi:hypothetical protein
MKDLVDGTEEWAAIQSVARTLLRERSDEK